MSSFRFLAQAAPALGFGFLLTFSSNVGQTYFIALFSGQLRQEFGLTHGELGGLYTTATLLSGGCMLWLGRIADRIDLRRLSLTLLVALAAGASLMALSQSSAWVFAGYLALRLFGQGGLSLVAITAMGRWFHRERGRALSITALGFAVGEALFPLAVANLLQRFDWREVWFGIAGLLVLFALPTARVLATATARRGLDAGHHATAHCDTVRSWTRAEVLRDRRFYLLLPGVLAPPFIVTGVLFHQVHLVAQKSWQLATFAACYPAFAAAGVVASLLTGWCIDRFSASRLLPAYLVPLALGLVLAATCQQVWVAVIWMALMGMTAGAATVLLGAVWPELYGVKFLGEIRGLTLSLMVFATALAPGAMGLLIDHGISLESQFAVLSAYVLVCAAGLGMLSPTLRPAYT